MLFEMLSGQPPFTGPTAQVIISRRFAHPAPHVRSVRPEVTPALDDVVARALQLKPSDRFATAAEFEDALRRALPAIAAVAPPAPERTDLGEASPTAGPPAASGPLRTRGLVIAGLALAALVLLLWVVIVRGR